MSMIEKAEEKIKEWLVKIALKKAIVKLAQLIVSWTIANKITFVATIGGVNIDLSNIEIMTAALFSFSEILRNWLKVKFPKYFGWI